MDCSQNSTLLSPSHCRESEIATKKKKVGISTAGKYLGDVPHDEVQRPRGEKELVGRVVDLLPCKIPRTERDELLRLRAKSDKFRFAEPSIVPQETQLPIPSGPETGTAQFRCRPSTEC